MTQDTGLFDSIACCQMSGKAISHKRKVKSYAGEERFEFLMQGILNHDLTSCINGNQDIGWHKTQCNYNNYSVPAFQSAKLIIKMYVNTVQLKLTFMALTDPCVSKILTFQTCSLKIYLIPQNTSSICGADKGHQPKIIIKKLCHCHRT